MKLVYHYTSKRHSLPMILRSRALQAVALARKRIRSHTDAEQKAFHEPAAPQERLEAIRERDRRDREREDQAAGQARRLWLQAGPADPDHPYLAREQLPPHNLLQDGEILLMPLFFEGKLVNLERTYPDGDKWLLPGGRFEGVASLIGDLSGAERVLVAESWLPAAALYEAMGCPVVIALRFWNLEPVACRLRQRFPEAEITICGNDYHHLPAHGLPNIGRVAARHAALAIDAKLLMPSFCETCESCTNFADVRLCRLGGDK